MKEGRRTPSAELEDRTSSRYVFSLQHGVLVMFNVSFIGNGRVRRDWKTRVHQNGASVLTTTKLIHRNFYLLTYFSNLSSRYLGHFTLLHVINS